MVGREGVLLELVVCRNPSFMEEEASLLDPAPDAGESKSLLLFHPLGSFIFMASFRLSSLDSLAFSRGTPGCGRRERRRGKGREVGVEPAVVAEEEIDALGVEGGRNDMMIVGKQSGRGEKKG